MQTIDTITVYLGSSGRCRPVFKDTAKQMGRILGAHDKHLVYGGMDAGLMGLLANAVLEAGGRVTGIIPKSLKDSERIHPSLHETILVPDLWERKRRMFERADALIALPGGFGTLDEALEVLYWGHLRMHAKPLVFVNTEGYWDDALAYLETLPDCARKYLLCADTPEDAIDKLERWNPSEIKLETTDASDHLPHFEADILQDTEAPIVLNTASVRDSYILATALGLKQLGKHARPIGLLNDKGQFDALLRWIERAGEEHFITQRCTLLYSVAADRKELARQMAGQPAIKIDLHTEKWGPGETRTHIEVKETE